MLVPYSDPAAGVPEPPGDFGDNYRRLKKLINKALKEGAPIEELRLIPKSSGEAPGRILSREDLLNLLRVIRRIRVKYQELLDPPVPKELEKHIREKGEIDRLPWETEALEKIDRWRLDVSEVRAHVQRELNDHLRCFDTADCSQQ
jgi:hypothetical protein